MAEQLSLRLDPALPRPGDLAPMWPVPRRDAFDDPGFLFEPTWGGHRVLAFVEPAGQSDGAGAIRLVDGRGTDWAPQLPELAGLAVRVAARSAVLDGELVVVDAAGRADDEALRLRLAGRPGRAVALLVFDLLHLDGRWLLNQPLEKRRAALRRTVRPGDEVVVVPSIAGEGRALLAAVSSQGIAGVLARRAGSPYLPGVHSRLWRSIAASRVDPAEARPEPDEAALTGDEPGLVAAGPAAATVLALFRRLPLDEPDTGF